MFTIFIFHIFRRVDISFEFEFVDKKFQLINKIIMFFQLSADFQNTDIMIKSKKTYFQVIFHISKHVYIYCILVY